MVTYDRTDSRNIAIRRREGYLYNLVHSVAGIVVRKKRVGLLATLD